uniref:Uncharacterized protein n=1 Tax=Nephila pilipes TaxID=299642 RepID=A0A8X6MUT1_NEPPI|nr:hypothetical protein NPIL_455401 [Nephila pilipes]
MACKTKSTENITISPSTEPNDDRSELWTHSALTTGACVMAFLLIIIGACIFYFRKIYLDRKNQLPTVIIDEETNIYTRAHHRSHESCPHS